MATRVCLSFFLIALFSSISTFRALPTPVKFGYSGENGPANWGKLSPSYTLCSNGKKQSPVHINKRNVVLNRNLQPLSQHYAQTVNASLFNTGVSVEVLFGQNCGDLVIDGKSYDLKQMHWHSPSEHILNGVRHEAELHLVHFTKDGEILVVAILFSVDHEDPIVHKILGKLSTLVKDESKGYVDAHIPIGKLELKELKKKTHKYYKYIGSLTVPPCTENVTWIIFGKVRSMSEEQLQLLKAPLARAYRWNARPSQPLNEREIEMFHSL